MKYTEKYGFSISTKEIAESIDKITSCVKDKTTEAALKRCFSLMDLTTLHTEDTVASVRKLVDKVNRLQDSYPDFPLPASVCVYPNFAPVVKSCRRSEALHVTTVSSCFPTAQSFLEVKVRECELAVEAGADEVDIVLSVHDFLAGDEDAAFAEIAAMKAAIDVAAAGRKVVLKVILETGLLASAENIAEASFLAMEAGADFIKTSTGKVSVNATPAAAYVMCRCIQKFYEATGRKVGFKAAGGISNAADAMSYYCIGAAVLGEDWITPELFRFGVSRLGNSLMGAILQETVSYF